MKKILVAINNLKYLFRPKFLKLILGHADDIYKLLPVIVNRTYCLFLSDNREMLWKAMPFLNSGGKFNLNSFNKPLRIVVGSSGKYQPGWIATDIHNIDILREEDFSMFVAPGSIDAILAEHVWEHLTIEEGLRAAKNCYSFLKKGGYLRVAVPDGFHADPHYLQYVKPGGHGPGSDDHKELYNYRTLSDMLKNAGFEVRLLEYYDDQGVFRENPWSIEDGLITRSRRFDPRNDEHTIRYSSLIVDAVK